jgi:hypothetical protein
MPAAGCPDHPARRSFPLPASVPKNRQAPAGRRTHVLLLCLRAEERAGESKPIPASAAMAGNSLSHQGTVGSLPISSSRRLEQRLQARAATLRHSRKPGTSDQRPVGRPFGLQLRPTIGRRLTRGRINDVIKGAEWRRGLAWPLLRRPAWCGPCRAFSQQESGQNLDLNGSSVVEAGCSGRLNFKPGWSPPTQATSASQLTDPPSFTRTRAPLMKPNDENSGYDHSVFREGRMPQAKQPAVVLLKRGSLGDRRKSPRLRRLRDHRAPA